MSRRSSATASSPSTTSASRSATASSSSSSGPSGCGKSTLLRMIAGLEEVTAGTIRDRRRGRHRPRAASPRHRDGLPELRALPAHDRAREPRLRPQGAPDAEGRDPARASTRSRRCSVSTELLDRKPAQLSGGQRQRVAMGRAIVREPQAFLMDEPLSNLDAKLRVGMRASLAQLHARLGVTTVYVTHDQTEAMTLGQRVAVMRDGRIAPGRRAADALRAAARPLRRRVHRLAGDEPRRGDDRRRRGRLRPFRVPLDAPTAARPRRAVVLGIRPEAFEDAALRAAGPADASTSRSRSSRSSAPTRTSSSASTRRGSAAEALRGRGGRRDRCSPRASRSSRRASIRGRAREPVGRSHARRRSGALPLLRRRRPAGAPARRRSEPAGVAHGDLTT